MDDQEGRARTGVKGVHIAKLLKDMLLEIPNIPHESVPVGKTEKENRMGESDTLLRLAPLPVGQGSEDQCGNG